jgi:hypothetical protein
MFPDPRTEDGVLILNINTTIYAPRRSDPTEPRLPPTVEN